jgi:hypothetical protein
MVRFLKRLLTFAFFPALVACGAAVPSLTPTPSPIVAPPGTIVIPECGDSEDCEEGFVVGGRFYGLTCFGVDPAAVAGDALAVGEGTYAEVREITAIPPGLWLAVRGDVPCLPAQNEPLEHEWYLAQSDVTPADLHEWGEAVGQVTLP